MGNLQLTTYNNTGGYNLKSITITFMSKKHKNQFMQAIQASTGGNSLSHEAEYRIIKFDLLKVVVLNAVYLVVILALYFVNQKSHVLDSWFAKLLHF